MLGDLICDAKELFAHDLRRDKLKRCVPAAAVKRTAEIDHQINHHPWRTLGLSFFFGYVAGLTLPARSKTKNHLAEEFVQARQWPERTDNGEEISKIKAAMFGAMTSSIHDIVREGLPVLAS